jgi:putative ABC transport system permease protein
MYSQPGSQITESMLQNYFKTAWRNIVRNKSFSFINIIGLSVSMSVCLLIILITADQKSYDRFHRNSDRIYRVHTTGRNGDGMKVASSALPLAARLRDGYPSVEASAGLVKNIGGDLFYEDKVASGGGYFADGNLFRVLDFQLEQGDTRTALEKPFSMVISEELASQLFYNENPIGKTIKFNDTGINPGGPETGNTEKSYGQFFITGVLKPNPGKTSLPFKLLASLSTLNALTKDSILSYPPNNWNDVWTNYTYVLMRKGKSQADLQGILDAISAKQYPKGKGNEFSFRAIALTDIMPADPMGNPTCISMPKTVLIILSVLCLIVMLSACLNYTNLSIARQLNRAKEVGVRKVSGATRGQIFTQFISEAVLVSLFSLFFSLFLLTVFQQLFSGLWLNRYLNITFRYTPGLCLLFVVFSIAVGLIAGLLPSIYMSMFNPVQILKGLGNIKLIRRLTVRKVLLAVQFSVSMIFIISTSLIYLQGRHVLNFDYGFNKENVVNIKLLKADNYGRFAQAISSGNHVTAVSACTYLPGTGSEYGELVRKTENPKDSLQVDYLDVDAGCLKVWGLQLVAGQNLPAIPGDKDDHFVLINERMAEDLHYGSAKQAVGQHLTVDRRDLEIAGVLKDFQFLDVTRRISPLMLRNRSSEFGYITVRVAGPGLAGTVAFLQDTWKKVNPSSKFEYEFFDQQLMTTHAMMSDTAGILGVLSFLAVLISCLGLLGMATYTAETRRKEVSLRKVLGSSVRGVILLLSKSFLVLLLIAVLISVPVALLINNMWLQFFASRISITPWIILVNVLALTSLSLIIIFSQAWKVSRANPAESLRME